MFKRLKIKHIFALLLVTCLLAGGIAALPVVAYAEPTEDPAATQEVTEGEGTAEDTQTAVQAPSAPAATPQVGIVVEGADEEEDNVNPMDAILSVDRVVLDVWSKIVSRLVIVLGILIAIVVGIVIYIMVTQTTKVSKQNKEMERRPDRQITAPQAGRTPEQPQRQVKQFGDTLRIRRTVSDANAAPANMQRPVAPQRPSRSAQGMAQPGVRRPVQGQPVRRPVQGQPQRPMNPAARPMQGQPMRRPVQGQPQRPMNPAARPMQGQPVSRPVQPQQRDQQ